MSSEEYEKVSYAKINKWAAKKNGHSNHYVTQIEYQRYLLSVHFRSHSHEMHVT